MQIPKRRYDKNDSDDFDPYITQEKYQEIKDNLDKMVNKIRPKLAKEVEEHAKLGDFSENAAYQMAKGKLRGLNYRILKLENALNKAIIIKPKKNSKIVELGNKVTIETNGKQYTYTILGAQEADPEQGIISYLSPIGSVLLNRKINEEVEVEINDQIKIFKIIKIN